MLCFLAPSPFGLKRAGAGLQLVARSSDVSRDNELGSGGDRKSCVSGLDGKLDFIDSFKFWPE